MRVLRTDQERIDKDLAFSLAQVCAVTRLDPAGPPVEGQRLAARGSPEGEVVGADLDDFAGAGVRIGSGEVDARTVGPPTPGRVEQRGFPWH